MKCAVMLLAIVSAVGLASAPVQAGEQGSLGIGIGIVKPKDIDSTLWFTANFRIKVTNHLVIEPEAGIWKKTEKAFGVEASLQDLSFGGNVLLVSGGDPLKIWGGGGLGAHLIKGTLGIGGLGSASETETKLGIHLLGGVDYKVSNTLDLYGAGRYDIVDLGDDDNLNELKFYGGLRFKF